MSKTRNMKKQQYRPVAEFDEATQASKREYWRTKKREQRAKLSTGKRKSRSRNTGICKPVCTSVTDKPVSHIPHSKLSHTLHNGNGSYQTDATRKPCKEELKSLSHKELNLDASMAKHGKISVSKGLPVSTACMKFNPNSSENHQTQTRSSALNGNFFTTSKQTCVPNAVSQFAPRCNTHMPPKIKCSVPPRSLAFMECNINKDQQHLKSSSNTNTKAYAYVAQCSTAPKLWNTKDMTMTEEEKVAKRRENWRIKKREQRAKRAQMLKMHRERKQEKTGKLSCTASTHPLPSVNTMVLRRGKQPTSTMSVNLNKSVQHVVNVEKNHLLPSRQSYHIQQPVVKVMNGQGLLSRNLPLASVNKLNYRQDSELNHMSISSRVSVPPTRVTHATQSKMQPPKFVQIQRRQHTPQRNNRAETPEERLAKQREYWRIKKRLQRAKHSIVAKARLKEQNAFNWRAKCYQSIMEQIRRTPTSFPTVSQPNASETITGFIQEDGTVSTPALKTAARRRPPSYLAVPSNSHSQKIANIRARPVLHSLPNNTNSSMNIHQNTASQNVPTSDPIFRSKQVNSTADAKVLKSLSTAYQTEKPSKDQTHLKRNVNRCDSSTVDPPTLVSTPHESTRQDPIYPSIASVFSLSEQSQSTDSKGIKTTPSPPEAKSDTEPLSVSDNQASTLLVVASMQKLLEESLSSVVDKSSSTTEDKLLPCKTEDNSYSQEDEEKDTKPDLIILHDSGDTRPTVEVKQSPSPCQSVSQTHHFPANSTSHTQLPCTATAARPYFSQPPGNKRHDQPVLVGVNPSYKGNQIQNRRAAIPRKRCSRLGNRSLQLNEGSDLQKKREYWRVMKRQQRARKAKETAKSKDAVQHSQQMQRKQGSFQFPHPPAAQSVSHTDFNNHVIQATVTSRPTRPVLSPTTSANQQPSNMLSRHLLFGGQQSLKKSSQASQANKWHSRCQRPDPALSAKPGAVTLMQTNHVKLSVPPTQTSGTLTTASKSNQSHYKTTANKELDAEEIINRKRMQWRIKKQEQRARKAAQERELSQQRTLGHMEHNWSNNCKYLVQSTPPEKLNYLSESCQTTSLKDEADVCVIPDDDCSDDHLTEAKWRSMYLMDYDPINQLLVCMVCGEQQYTFSAEAVRAHIQETHPSTLCLEDMERQSIQHAWDQQVAMRERFYTNQLWQNSDAPNDQSLKHTAEIEVILEADDKSK